MDENDFLVSELRGSLVRAVCAVAVGLVGEEDTCIVTSVGLGSERAVGRGVIRSF